jgi:hypothetical protein
MIFRVWNPIKNKLSEICISSEIWKNWKIMKFKIFNAFRKLKTFYNVNINSYSTQEQ